MIIPFQRKQAWYSNYVAKINAMPRDEVMIDAMEFYTRYSDMGHITFHAAIQGQILMSKAKQYCATDGMKTLFTTFLNYLNLELQKMRIELEEHNAWRHNVVIPGSKK